MTTMAPVGSEGGNTIPPQRNRRITASKNWVFTWNNYVGSLAPFQESLKRECSWAVYQHEIGESGTPHLQGAISLKKKGRPIEIFKIKEIHWEKMRGTPEEAVAYCTKEDTRNGSIFTHGDIPEVEVLTYRKDGWYPWQQEIIGLCDRAPKERVVYWIYDPDGCRGKSTICKYLAIEKGAFVCGGECKDILYGIASLKTKPKIVCIDVPRSSYGKISYKAIELIKNGMFYSGKYESKMVVFNVPHVFVFANEMPEEGKLTADRYCYIDLDLELYRD